MTQVVLIAHDIRSTFNVGALLRTAECFGVTHVYFSGYTPYPHSANDPRLPHIATKLTTQIHKTALGAENLQPWSYEADIVSLLSRLRDEGYAIAALEQTAESHNLATWQPPSKVALLLGREVEGIEAALLKQSDIALEIPQFGQKESLNVIQAAAIALYEARRAEAMLARLPH